MKGNNQEIKVGTQEEIKCSLEVTFSSVTRYQILLNTPLSPSTLCSPLLHMTISQTVCICLLPAVSSKNGRTLSTQLTTEAPALKT